MVLGLASFSCKGEDRSVSGHIGTWLTSNRLAVKIDLLGGISPEVSVENRSSSVLTITHISVRHWQERGEASERATDLNPVRLEPGGKLERLHLPGTYSNESGKTTKVLVRLKLLEDTKEEVFTAE
jgi:hypothetical protein